jgi:hypothetical protein
MNYNMAENISKQTTRAVIGAMHVNRSLPRTLAFAPPKLLRLVLWHHCKQTYNRSDNTKKGKMYIMIFEYAQLLSSIAFLILQNPCPNLLHITDPLIVTICQFLAESGLNIVIPQLYIPQPLCKNDSNIMSEIMMIKKSPT